MKILQAALVSFICMLAAAFFFPLLKRMLRMNLRHITAIFSTT
jgi:hypothetical protein